MSKTHFKFTLGADPEVFIGRDGKFISAHGMVAGTKSEPTPVANGAVQVDGMALEFNLNPAHTEEEFLFNLDSVSSELLQIIGDDYQFLHDVSVFFSEEDVKDVPELNKVLGCNPDFNAYSLQANPSPNSDMNMRTAGGHVHVGGLYVEDEWEYEHLKETARMARLMDKFVGVYSVLWDGDDQRRKLYGGAGAFRPKVYGMEYRTMSNAWIFSRDLASFVYRQTEKAVEAFVNGEDNIGSHLRDIINTSDRDNSFFKFDPTAMQVKEIANAGAS